MEGPLPNGNSEIKFTKAATIARNSCTVREVCINVLAVNHWKDASFTYQGS